MRRRDFLGTMAGGVAAWTVLGSDRTCRAEEDPEARGARPNILFLLSDDQRWDGLSCYGNQDLKTPHIDRLATEGARLDCFYPACPLCCPSRGAFLSGLYPHQNGVTRNSDKGLKPGTVTVANLLGAAGYATGFTGKTHLPNKPLEWGFKDTLREPGGPDLERHAALFKGAGDYIEQHRKVPWCLWVATHLPHFPYLKDPKFSYAKEGLKAPPGWPKGQEFKTGEFPEYYSAISHLDEQVGSLLKRLDDLGLARNTLVLFASDNGYMHGSHNWPSKRIWYEESARTCALARWPAKIKAGTKVPGPLSGVDLLPTICELTGAKKPAECEGTSMLPALTGGPPLRQAAFAEFIDSKEGWQMVRTPRHKYVRPLEGQKPPKKMGGNEILYDLQEDPSEANNLAGSGAHAKVLEEMRKQHADWIKLTATTEAGRGK